MSKQTSLRSKTEMVAVNRLVMKAPFPAARRALRLVKVWVLVNLRIALMRDDEEAFVSLLKRLDCRITFYAPLQPWKSTTLP